jgi:hypothetical protein
MVFMPPPGPPPGVQQPTAPPPAFIPQQPATFGVVDPRAIGGCMFRNTFVWLRDGDQLWFFPVVIGRRSVGGFRWTGRFWRYISLDFKRIFTFTCF